MNTPDVIAQLDALFHPESVAIVGVPRGLKTGKLLLMSLLDQGFPGPIYPIHPHAEEIDGLKVYPNVSAVPGPVDLAIVLVPHPQTLAVLKDCAVKGVKGAILFTAGYKETGSDEGIALEEELALFAHTSGMRLIGPNCMGLYSPQSGLSFFPQLPVESGPVGLISQSGSLANMICRMAPLRGLRFSKAVSLGNECDLTSTDFLTYLARDTDTRLIGTYLEGIKDGPGFLRALYDASLSKPVILWKVGMNPEGQQAVISHTGSLASSREIWDGAVRQGGAVTVSGYDAWADALMAFSLLPPRLGERMAIISGPGGLAVSAAEACGRHGLKLAQLSPRTKKILEDLVPPTGTSIRNPIDVGMTASFDLEIYISSARAAAEDPGVDAVVVIGRGMEEAENLRFTDSMIQACRDSGKPFLLVKIPGFDGDTGFAQKFCEAGIPFFDSAERAMETYAKVLNYQLWRSERTHNKPMQIEG
ncbi:acetate--CoA ligase family protein [Thermodesulfobacteriota bacterium]